MPNSGASLSTYTTMMRVTDAGRPYAKDLHDLFAALLVQLPLGDHRSLFRSYPSTFTTDEAVARLSDLKFTHIVRMPDPNDPSCQVATRTTTTFSMNRDMAKSLGQHFLNARLIESATDPQNRSMKDKGIWSPTPKGKYMIQDFSQRAHVSMSHMQDTLARIDSFRIFSFERLPDNDSLSFSRPNMTNAFKTMMAWLPSEKLMADDVGGVRGKDMHEYSYTFYGYQCTEWVIEYATVVSKDEAEMIASEFVLYGWIGQVLDKSDRANCIKDEWTLFKSSRSALYFVTDKGRKVLGWNNAADDTDTADTIKSESSASLPSQEKEVITQRQQKHAERLQRDNTPVLVPDSAPVVVPSATVTNHQTRVLVKDGDDRIQAGTESTIIDKHYDFGFRQTSESDPLLASDPEPTEPDIDTITERLLKLRSQGYHDQHIKMTRNVSATSSSTANTLDSGVEVTKSAEDSRRQSMLDTAVDATDMMMNRNDNSQWARLCEILEDPLKRMCFRDYMRTHFCEENINFWVDYFNVRKKLSKGRGMTKELLSDCYAIYDSYLKENAPFEVNIDHTLRQEIVTLVTTNFSIISGSEKKSVPFVSSATEPPVMAQTMVVVNAPSATCLKALMQMYDKVNDHICRIMEQDSVPRFLKSEKYHQLMSGRTFEPIDPDDHGEDDSNYSYDDEDDDYDDSYEEEDDSTNDYATEGSVSQSVKANCIRSSSKNKSCSH